MPAKNAQRSATPAKSYPASLCRLDRFRLPRSFQSVACTNCSPGFVQPRPDYPGIKLRIPPYKAYATIAVLQFIAHSRAWTLSHSEWHFSNSCHTKLRSRPAPVTVDKSWNFH